MQPPTVLSYSASDHETWRLFYKAFMAQIERCRDRIHPIYLNHISALAAFSTAIPSLAEIRQVLKPIGWSAKYVDGYTPSWTVSKMLARRIMPISRAIRPPTEVFFAAEPDLIHDVFGHLPSLFSAEYRDLLATWANNASRAEITPVDRAHYHLNKLIVQSREQVAPGTFGYLESASQAVAAFIKAQPSAIQLNDRLYFWLFEFGIVEEDRESKIFGAGILSSLSELAKISTTAIATKPLTVEALLAPCNISSEQEGYLVARNVEDLRRVLAQTMLSTRPFPALAARSEVRYAQL